MMAAAARQSDWPKERPTTAESTTDAERAKEYVSDKERDLERQRRREERARRRDEREQEREREQRKEEERARRHREKERPPKDRDGRTTKDDNLQYYAVYPQLPTKHTSTVPSSRHRGDDRSSVSASLSNILNRPQSCVTDSTRSLLDRPDTLFKLQCCIAAIYPAKPTPSL